MKSALPGVLAVIIATAAFAQTPPQTTPLAQAISPELYPKLLLNERQSYLAGVLDPDRVLFPQSKAQFAACLSGTTIAQLTEVVG